MRKALVAGACALVLFVVSAFVSAETPTQRATRTFEAAIARNCVLELGHDCGVSEVERLPVVDGVVHYRFEVRVGPGAYDVIRTEVLVSWPSSDTSGFALEQAGTLTAPANWFSNTASVTDDGTTKSLTLPATNPAQFFRLRRP